MWTLLVPILAQTMLPLSELPEPVAAYAQQFTRSCHITKQGAVVANEMYVEKLFGVEDVNLDGEQDYFAYACMFGCEGDHFAFASGSPPCPDGVMIMSSQQGYVTIRLPGTIKRIFPGERPVVVLTRRRNLGDGCTIPFGCQYIYEVRDGRFQLVGECPEGSCDDPLRER
jgi:hypothetical protein